MSMSADQRRVESLREESAEWGKLRLAKESNKYDRRYRLIVVEWCPPQHVGTDLEEYAYQVMRDWWPINKETMAKAHIFYEGVRMGLLANRLMHA